MILIIISDCITIVCYVDDELLAILSFLIVL